MAPPRVVTDLASPIPRREGASGDDPYLDELAKIHENASGHRDFQSAPLTARIAALSPSIATMGAIVGLLIADHRLPSTTEFLCHLALAVLYLLAYRTTFLSRAGSVVPTQPILIALVLTTPLTVVPCIVAGAAIVTGWLDGFRTPRTLFMEVGNAAHTLAFPALMWGTRDSGGVAQPSIWLLATAIALQFAVDAVAGYLHERPSGVSVQDILVPVRWSWTFDIFMSVLGWGLTMAALPYPPAALVICTATPFLLVRFLAQDREMYLREAMKAQQAYTTADHAAHHDPMTGLANRAGWEKAVAEAERRLAEHPGEVTCTVLAADMDKLKMANDHFGHEVGDQLITDFATLLRDCLPADTTVARLGGDEFTALFVAPARRGTVDLKSAVRRALHDHETGLPVRLSASLGQAYVRRGEPIAQAASEADHAAREDKAQRRFTRETAVPTFSPGAPGARGPGSPNGIRVFRP